MHKRLVKLSTKQIQDLQINMLQKLYTFLNRPEGDKGRANALKRYDATVEVLLHRLGKDAEVHLIDQEKACFFSDWYKEVNNFRPRGYTYEGAVKWMEREQANPTPLDD